MTFLFLVEDAKSYFAALEKRNEHKEAYCLENRGIEIFVDTFRKQ